jgi:hypothetical protein
LLSWVRAKLRAMTAAHPSSLAIWGGQDAKSVLERVARDKALVEQTQFRPDQEHDRGALLAHSLSAFSAISQKGEQLANGEVAGERAQPDLAASVRSMVGGSFEAAVIAAGNAHGVAVQFVADDAHLTPYNFAIEWLVGAGAGMEEAGVVGDAAAAHML